MFVVVVQNSTTRTTTKGNMGDGGQITRCERDAKLKVTPEKHTTHYFMAGPLADVQSFETCNLWVISG